MLYQGDSLEVLKSLEENSLDSLITDPPAGISFMGAHWDKPNDFIKNMTAIFKECLRVLKPGAHGLVWALPRTSHWTALALEEAGFEIRDVVVHIFGSGFPKGQNISKTIDKVHGIDEAKEWQGWGSALKPAHENWILVRKPLSEKTLAKNVLKHGTGGINIDGSRVDLNEAKNPSIARHYRRHYAGPRPKGEKGWKHPNHSADFSTDQAALGRFPANLVLSEESAKELDEYSGKLAGDSPNRKPRTGGFGDGNIYGKGKKVNGSINRVDSGGASRFFYVPKASKKDRGEGNTHPTVKNTKLMEYFIKLITPPGGTVLDPFMGSGSTGVTAKRLKFKFVGIEKEPKYFEIAEKRVTAAAKEFDNVG